MMRRAFAVMALCAGAAPTVSAQDVSRDASTLRVRIVERGAGSPIALAEARRADGAVIGRSDADGDLLLRIDARAWPITVRALGYRAVTLGDSLATRGAVRLAMDALATVLSTVTTTAGQRVTSGAEITGSVVTLDRRQIASAQAVSVNQLLRQIPGLQEMPTPPSQSTMSIRGLDGPRVLVLIDGEPAAGALIDNRDIGRVSTMAVDRIEVTKGPSGVEYGSDALGGVINVVTAAPTERLTVDGMFRRGGLGRLEATGGASGTFGDLGYRVNGGWRQVDRVIGQNAVDGTLDRVFDLRSDFRYELGAKTSLRANVQGVRERQRWPLGGGYYGFIDNNSTQGLLEGRRAMFGGELRLRGFAQRFAYEYRQAAGRLPIAGSADSLRQHERLERALLAYSRAAGRHRIDAGAQFSARAIDAPEKVEHDRASDRVGELFVRDAIQLGAVVTTAGVRTTSSRLWGNTVSPSLGLAWQATPAWRLRANSARGFRAPGFKEMRYTFLNPSGGYTVVGNADLEPETSWSHSAGVTWAPVAAVVVDLEAYRNDVSSLIDTRYQGTNAAGFLVYQNVNVAQARTSGVEGTVRVISGPSELTLGADFLRARDRVTGISLDRRAARTARAAYTRHWALAAGAITDVIARYTGSAPVVQSESNGGASVVGRQGAFTAVDLQLRLAVRTGAELSFGVTNLLAQRPAYYTAVTDRQFNAGLRMSWER